MPDAVDTVVCAPEDGWRNHPKYVEQFPEINKLCNVASCWIYISEYTYDARKPERYTLSLSFTHYVTAVNLKDKQ